MRVSSLESVGKEIVCRKEMLWDHIVGVGLSSARAHQVPRAICAAPFPEGLI